VTQVEAASPLRDAPADETRLPTVNVESSQSDALVGPYQQPRWSARGRFSSETDVYVLPPYTFYVDLDYEGTFPRHGSLASNLFTQEFELGLPGRFQVAFENNFESHLHHTQETVETIEGRWTLADWRKIPLNPTLFAEYKFGVGRDYERASDPDDAGEDEEEKGGGGKSKGVPHLPNGYELRLLLGEQIGKNGQWALNLFCECETGGDREVEAGFSQAFSYAIHGEDVRVGAEMQFIRRTEHSSRSDPQYEFDLGPSFSVKPTSRTRFDVAALFGTTSDSPALKVFAVFSIEFGRGEDREVSAPVSTQNR